MVKPTEPGKWDLATCGGRSRRIMVLGVSRSSPGGYMRASGLVLTCLWVVAGCGGAEGEDGDGTVPRGSRGDESIREQCDPSGHQVVATDVNNDQRPDIRHVLAGGREICTQYDMNFDGQSDITRIFSPDGRVPVREEHEIGR